MRLVAARFGVVAPRHYLRVATEEAILLKEAQTLVGKMCWREIEDIDDLTAEYWRLRQLDAEEKEIRARVEGVQAEHDRLRGLIADPLNPVAEKLTDVGERLDKERDALTEQLHHLQERISEAEGLRKRFNGLKLKLSVLKGEGAAAAQLEEVRGQMQGVKADYSQIATKVDALRQEIDLHEEQIRAIEDEEKNLRAQASHHERVLTREVSDVSRRIVEDNARLSVIEGERVTLFVTIGRHLCRAEGQVSEPLRAVMRRYAPVIGRARSLGQSIERNRRLADFR